MWRLLFEEIPLQRTSFKLESGGILTPVPVDLAGNLRQHDITVPVHLSFVHLDARDFPRYKNRRQIKHPIRCKRATTFHPELVIIGREQPPLLEVAVNMHVVADGAQACDPPARGKLLQCKKSSALGRSPCIRRVRGMTSSRVAS